MKKTKEITCRYGVTYKETLSGTAGEIGRTFDWLTRCCCWCCYNHDCKEPREEKLDENECCEACSVFSKVRFCDKEPILGEALNNNQNVSIIY